MKNKYLIIVYLFGILLFGGQAIAAQTSGSGVVKYIDIINWSHTDYGFTDHPLIVSEIHKHYIDIAIDYVELSKKNRKGEQFTWTVESLDPLLQWWNQAVPERRKLLLKAIDNGNIDVNVLPFGIHPLLNETETEQFLNWMPQELYTRFRTRIAIQNDVNGFPRSVAKRLPEKGIRYIWLGMNGRHPFPIPTLSWWKMPDGQKLLLWNGGAYWDGYDYLGIVHWKAHPREASDLTTRWPRDKELFPSDEKSVRKANELCLRKLKQLEQAGYSHSILPVTISNVWRGDNDGPYWGIVEFVQKWNELGLEPELRLSTTTASMERMEKMSGNIATLTGEFGDWWAFGMTALPRETATARAARYLLQASVSPLLGTQNEAVLKQTEQINRDLCTFYEHTFASKTSGSDMYGIFNQGSMNEVNRYAYKAYENAKWQLARRVRTMLGDSLQGVYVLNTQKFPCTGWVWTEFSALRNRNATGVIDPVTKEKYPFIKDQGKVKFWVNALPGNSIKRYELTTEEMSSASHLNKPVIQTDKNGWPQSVRWSGMKEPLFQGEIGAFLTYAMTSGGWWGGDAVLEMRPTTPVGMSKVSETPYTIVYEQKLDNERLVSLKRVLEVYKDEPRVKLKLVYDRKLHPSREKEIFYVQFPLPATPEAKILTSNGGSVFTPYEDNIPNTCKRFYAVDSWVAYQSGEGCRVWSSKTSPIVSFGDNEFFKKEDFSKPQDANLLRSMVYNNSWGLNFPVEYGGIVICDYDLYWTQGQVNATDIQQVTDTYLVEPVITIVPKERETPAYRKWMNGEELRRKQK